MLAKHLVVCKSTDMTAEINKAEGMFVGLAIGDALGAPLEFGHSSKDIRRNWDGHMHDHRLPKGYYTDDTAMALCLADSLLERNGYDSYDVMDRYTRWVRDGYRDSEGFPASDVGSQTRNAIIDFGYDPIVPNGVERSERAGNGGIMRLAPAVLSMADRSIDDAMALAKISSRETHYSNVADAAAELFGSMIWKALHEEDKANIVDTADYSSGAAFDDIARDVQKVLSMKSDSSLRDLNGYAVSAIKTAVWGFSRFENFEKGMKEVIKLGGDTDTNAAIYGQLAGAYYGYESIPDRWLEDLYKQDEIKQIAGELLNMQNNGVIRTRFEEDGPEIFSRR